MKPQAPSGGRKLLFGPDCPRITPVKSLRAGSLILALVCCAAQAPAALVSSSAAASAVTVTAASSVTPGAAVSPNPGTSTAVAQAVADYASFPALISGTVAALAAPLAGVLKGLGAPGMSVAAGGFRELVTGERSPLCDRLDKGLSDQLRDASPYGVPSTLELADAWVSVGGSSANLADPGVLAHFGRILDVQAVVLGDYRVVGDDVLLRVRLMRCADGTQVWERMERLPVSALQPADLDRYAGSAPSGYGESVEAPPPPALVPVPGATPAPASSAARVPGEHGYLSGVHLESNVAETEFSPYRLNFELGYEYDVPDNTRFRSLERGISAPVLGLNWADIAWADFFVWGTGGVAGLQNPVSGLFGYGLEGMLTLPVRLGHYWVVYGGLGGRFEGINVSSSLIPSGDTVSFGNNSGFFVVGAKAHRGPWGVDLSASYGPENLSQATGYFTARLGLYYEYSFH